MNLFFQNIFNQNKQAYIQQRKQTNTTHFNSVIIGKRIKKIKGHHIYLCVSIQCYQNNNILEILIFLRNRYILVYNKSLQLIIYTIGHNMAQVLRS